VIYFHVLITIRAERFKTFVILFRHEHVTRGAISHLFADRLAFQLVRMFFETRATYKVSVARLARNSIFSVHTRRNRLAVATRLSTLMCQATSTHFITTFTHILSRQRTRKTVNNMNMSTYVIIHQVNSFFGFYLSIEIYVLAMQSPKTTISYSLKCSWNLNSPGTPPPREGLYPSSPVND